MARTTGSMPLNDPYPDLSRPSLRLVKSDINPVQEQTENIPFDGGVIRIDNPDGTTTFDFGGEDVGGEDKPRATAFDDNLAERMSEDDLAKIASDLLEGVDRDIQSRKEWLETRAIGMQLLGLKLEKPRADVGNATAPLEGMSTVRHPLLLEATVSFQATARAELLPAAGPVKVRNDTPTVPRRVIATPNQADPNNPYPSMPPPESVANSDELAQALERDLNHYLLTATDYVADTDRMLFYVGFGGDGFKKVYNCPMRRRPISESVDAEDLIISNAATDIANCGRVTHRIKMRQSTMKRMQFLKVYRDVDLAPPQQTNATPVDVQKNDIAGYNPSVQRVEDRDYEIYEIYCELDLDQFAPKRFKGKGIPLPYRVTIEKESRQVLDIRRNWNEKDKEAKAKEYFVQFPMVRGLGFYGLGYIHLLGNTTIALTASWRLQLDNGMFANFPGFLYSKGIGRQLTNQFRVPPGGGVGLDIGAQQSIKDAIMPLPYKETGPSFANFTTHVEEVGRRLAQTANIQVGEGKQDAPVGTTLALIEQATKVQDSAHKRLHAAQDKEFKLLVERFREDPEAFFRHCPDKNRWQKEQFLQALDDYNIVPVADPNNPTSLHRLAKAMAIKELQKGSPALYDPVAVDLRVMQIADIDPQGLFRPTPATPPPDPRLEAIKEKSAASNRQNQIQLLESQIKAQTAMAQIKDKQADRETREKIERMKIMLEILKMEEEKMIHGHEMQQNAVQAQFEAAMEQLSQQQQLELDRQERMHTMRHDAMERQANLYSTAMETAGQQQIEQQKHQAEMARDTQRHVQDMQHERERHAAELEMAKKMAAVTKKEKSAKEGKSKPKKGKT